MPATIDNRVKEARRRVARLAEAGLADEVASALLHQIELATEEVGDKLTRIEKWIAGLESEEGKQGEAVTKKAHQQDKGSGDSEYGFFEAVGDAILNLLD